MRKGNNSVNYYILKTRLVLICSFQYSGKQRNSNFKYLCYRECHMSRIIFKLEETVFMQLDGTQPFQKLFFKK